MNKQIYYWHPTIYKLDYVDGDPYATKTRMSIAYTFLRDGLIAAGFSTCNPGDTFSKSKGREMAEENLVLFPLGFHVPKATTPKSAKGQLLNRFKLLSDAGVSAPGVPAKWTII